LLCFHGARAENESKTFGWGAVAFPDHCSRFAIECRDATVTNRSTIGSWDCCLQFLVGSRLSFNVSPCISGELIKSNTPEKGRNQVTNMRPLEQNDGSSVGHRFVMMQNRRQTNEKQGAT
jgi:hypothetical protein